MAHASHDDSRSYRTVLLWLLGLTVFTVVTAKYVDLGVAGNTAVALLIASLKAFLVATIFMHLKHENPLTWTYALFPVVLLLVLIGGLMIDNPLRLGKNEPPASQTAAGEGGHHSEPVAHH